MAMKKVDRGYYTSTSSYEDAPQSIGSNVTISAPHMHAHALEHLNIKSGDNILDVGSGSGYLTACMAHMVGNGKVTGIDHIKRLVTKSIENVRKDPKSKDLLDTGRLSFELGDGRNGFEANAPYDLIHVGAASPRVPPKLIEQLKIGGRIIIPVGEENSHQSLDQVDKLQDGTIKRKQLMGVCYVPLTSVAKQER